MQRPVICLFGDSLTQYGHGCERAFTAGSAGWGDRLEEQYVRRADVLNRGCAQYNTRAALVSNLVPNLNASDPKPNAMLVTVWFGANDSCVADKEPQKHVPLDEYGKNLEEIINRVQRLTSNIIIITPPPIREDTYFEWRRPQVSDPSLIQDRKNEIIELYAQRCREVASRQNICLVDAFAEFSAQKDYRSLLSDEDGLHFSGAGDVFVYNLVAKAISERYPEIYVKSDPFIHNFGNSASTCPSIPPFLPYWDQIDNRNFRSQLAGNLDDDEERVEKVSWPARPAIVLLGDSLSQQGRANPVWCQSDVASPAYAGWGDVLAARYVRRLDLYNRGHSGYNTRWILAAFERIMLSSERRVFPIELATVFFGANDAADATLNPRQHVPLSEFEANIEEIVRRCKNEWNVRRIVVIGCPPVDREKYLAYNRARPSNKDKTDSELLDRSTEVAKKYALAAEKVAKKQKVPFLDTFELFGDSAKDYLSDGLHLTPRGNNKLGDALIQLIDHAWPELKCTPDTLRRKYGFYGSVCRACPPEQLWFADMQSILGTATLHSKKRVKL